MDPQLLDFIRKAKAASETDEEIRSSLASAGWEAQEIDQAFMSFQTSANNLPISVPSSSPNNTMKPSLGKIIVPLIVVVVLLVVGITAGYVVLKSPPKAPSSVTNTPKITPSVIPKEKPSVVSISPQVVLPTTVQGQPITVNTTRNILAYTETPQQDKPPVLVFYDITKKQRLPPDPVIEADKNYMIQLGPWSPNGRYLPILAYTGPWSQESNINFYLFDSKTLHVKRIYSEPRSEENSVWASTSFNFTSAWKDETKLVVSDKRSTQGLITSITYISIDGIVTTIEQAVDIKKMSQQLEYSMDLGVIGAPVKLIKVGPKTLSFVPEGDIVGVVEGMLAVLTKPDPVLSMQEISGPDLNPDLVKQIQELQNLGLSQEDLSNRMLELMEPKGETVLRLYNINDGGVVKSISLTDNTWQTQNVLVHPSERFLIAHQTNKYIQATKHRFVRIDPLSEPSFQSIAEEDVDPGLNQPYLSFLMTRGTSFYLSTDGNSIIGMRGSIPGNPMANTIFTINIANGQEDIVCLSNCADMRVFYPYLLETRY